MTMQSLAQCQANCPDLSLYLYEHHVSNTCILDVQVYSLVEQLDTEALQERRTRWRVAEREHVALRWFQAVPEVSCLLM